ncbi:Cytosol aminopeptidase [Granulibacter bethesdensis]|uniref:leucyl aminopeptidase family protein n=1 Tax=Granulibacter bethesdensis TaxID=364410 RepID=UPI000909597C|nr:leucyl aminopeptidase family protein [Granulibacter bethesdensis]APH56112.1 Cytosol aminopeptidase [Granulibacter bethesdensis]
MSGAPECRSRVVASPHEIVWGRPLECFVEGESRSLPIFPLRPKGLEAFLAGDGAHAAGFLRGAGLTAKEGQLLLYPAADGTGPGGAVLGLGASRDPWSFGDLSSRLPADTVWHLEPGDYAPDQAALGFALGAYRFDLFKGRQAAPVPARLVVPAESAGALEEARAVWLARDLINTPPNRLGPQELAEAVRRIGHEAGAAVEIVTGPALETAYPAIAAVGAGSDRPPAVAILRWQGSRADETSPLIALCGKGVVFDTGGYDLKPSAAMLRMKKDMGGAAVMLAAARLIMQRNLPIRLVLRIGCVENSVSGRAMRPSDVLRTRSGLTVEVGNTDAEGRLVLCDLLAEAAEESPSLLVDAATLTGAARVAAGPDLPVLFSNDPLWAERLERAGGNVSDPVCRLPLWDGYDSWLSSDVADLNSVSSRPFAGAIIAALFLRRFVPPETAWVHYDLYAWNDENRPGRPRGGEGQILRGFVGSLSYYYK